MYTIIHTATESPSSRFESFHRGIRGKSYFDTEGIRANEFEEGTKNAIIGNIK